MQTIVHKLNLWPIAISNIYGVDHDEATLQEAFDTWVACMHRGKHVLILDLTLGNTAATAPQRKRVASWIDENSGLLKSNRQLAHVLVVDSALVRGVITAVFWLRPPVNPHHTARNMEEAVDIAVAVLRDAAIPIEPEHVQAARNAGSRQTTSNRPAAPGP